MAILLQPAVTPMKTVCRPLLAILLYAAISQLLSGLVFAQDQPPQSPEGKAEAEAIYHIAEFVEWPEINAPKGTTFNFCVLGRDPFGELLEKAVLGHPIGEKPTMIARGSRLEYLGQCDVLFINSSESKRLPKILGQVRGKSVLTVSEARDFAGDGGVIQFLKDGNRISFVINVDAAQQAGLRIRAQLLSLAKVVHNTEIATKE